MKYRYHGPILVFDRLVSNNWNAETCAVSESKAMNNLKYQAKKLCNVNASSQISLPGEIKEVI